MALFDDFGYLTIFWQIFESLGHFVFRASGAPAAVLVGKRSRANAAGKNIFLQFWPLFGKIWQSFKNLGLFVFRASGEPAVVLVRRRRANPAGKVNVQVSNFAHKVHAF